MKKFINIALAVITLAFASCKTNNEEVRVYPETAAQKAIDLGTFNGTMTCESESGITQGDATIQFTACTEESIVASAGAGNVVVINVKCEALSFEANGPVNISHANDDLLFYNNKATTSFGAAVYGRVTGAYGSEAKVSLDFKQEKKVGRLTKTFVYSFK